MKPKSRRRSAILIWGLLGGLVLLVLWGDSFVRLTRFEVVPPSSLKMELCQGILSINWMEAPDWYQADWNAKSGWHREACPPLSFIGERRYWVPDFHFRTEMRISLTVSGPPGSHPVAPLHDSLVDHYLHFPLWQIFTLYVALCGAVFALRQRRRRREWQRRRRREWRREQAAGDPKLLE